MYSGKPPSYLNETNFYFNLTQIPPFLANLFDASYTFLKYTIMVVCLRFQFSGVNCVWSILETIQA